MNLASRPQEHQAQILDLSGKVNALIEAEIGVDNGSIYPGSASQYSL